MAAPAVQAAGGRTQLDLNQERQTRYWRTLLWLFRYFRPYRGRLAVAVFTMLAYSGTVVALPWTVKQAIDQLLATPPGRPAWLRRQRGALRSHCRGPLRHGPGP